MASDLTSTAIITNLLIQLVTRGMETASSDSHLRRFEISLSRENFIAIQSSSLLI